MALPKTVTELGDNEVILGRLERVLQRGVGVTPFVGAGLSRPYGFPLWRSFLLDLAAMTDRDDFVDLMESRLDAGEYEEAAGEIEAELTPTRFRVLFDSNFGAAILDKADVSKGAATVLPELAMGPVITTNFDNVLERVFGDANCRFEGELWGRRIGSNFSKYAHENQRILIKLHGDVDDPDDRILTLSEYRHNYGRTDEHGIDRDAPLPRTLLHILSSRPALFIGCSLEKDRTVSVVNELARTLPGADLLQYAILEAPKTRREFSQKNNELLSRKIGTIWFPPGGFELIEPILRHLAESIPPERRPTSSARSTASVPTNLRFPAKEFVGREQQVRRLTALMRRDRFATLVGPPGSVKTQLAVEVGRKLLSAFEDGVFFVSLSALSDPKEIPGHIADAIDRHEQAEKPPLHAIVAKLRDRRCLLILDRCEHLVEPIGEIVTELLGRTEHVTILATSRQLLGREGETKRRVGPMPLPPADTPPTLADLEKYEATLLFLTRIDDTGRREGITDEDAPLISEICRVLDGIPLAIELAASATKRDSLEAVFRGLQDRFGYLRSRVRGRSPRHKTLLASVAWSYEPLPPELQQLLRAVSVFQGGWDEAAAEAVSATYGGNRDDLRDDLWELVDRSLVERAPEDGRYSLLGTLRDFAFARLEEQSEAADTLRRHADFFVRLVEHGAPRLVVNAERPGWITRLDREQANVRVAIRRAREAGEFDTALRLGAGYWRVWELRGYLHEGRRVLTDLLEAAGPDAHGRPGARVLSGLSILAYRQGDIQRALEYAQAAYDIEVAMDPRDRARVAECLNDIGIATQQMGRLDEAAESYAESGRLFGEVVAELRSRTEVDREALASAVRQHAIAQYNRGNMEYMRGALDSARVILADAAANFKRIGMETELGFPLTALDRTLTEVGSFPEAEDVLKKALATRERLDIKGGQADSLHALGRLALAQGDPPGAAAYLVAGLGIQRDVEDRKGIALSLESLGLVNVALGDAERAATLFAVASRLLAELHLPIRPIDRAGLEEARDQVRNAGYDPTDATRARSLEEAIVFGLDELPAGRAADVDR